MYLLKGIFGMTPWFPVMALFAFASVIMFFQINSYKADKIGQPKGNRMFFWAGVVLGAIAVVCLIMAVKTSTGTAG